MLFQLESWKLDDYFDAISHNTFFDHVVGNLSTYNGQTQRSFAENAEVPRNMTNAGPLSLCDYSRGIIRVSVVSAKNLVYGDKTLNATGK